MFSNKNFNELLLISSNVLTKQNESTLDENYFDFIFCLLMKCNYLLNFRTEEYYLNAIDNQTNEIIFTFDNTKQLKDNLLHNIISLLLSHSVQSFGRIKIIVPLSYYINSTIDCPLSKSPQLNNKNKLFKEIKLIILKFFEVSENFVQSYLLLLILLFQIKEIIKYSEISIIIDCINLLFYITRESKQNISFFNKSIELTSFKEQLSVVNVQLLSFILHFSDILCLDLLSYLNEKEDLMIKYANASLIDYFNKQDKKDERDIVFESMANMIIQGKQKRSNINENELIKSIHQYSIISGKNNTLFCTKDNIVIEINSASQLSYEVSFTIQPFEDTMICNNDTKVKTISSLFDEDDDDIEKDILTNDSYHYNNNKISQKMLNNAQKNRDPKITKEIQNQIISILKTPILITYHINVFFYDTSYNKFTIDNLLGVNEKSFSPLFYSFLSQLGNIYIDNDGNKILSYKDYFYNIIFEFVDLRKKKEEKIHLIRENTINIIWIDNPYININNISFSNSIFQKEYVVITIIPKTKTHLLVTIQQSENQLTSFDYSSNKSILLNDMICESFFLNINAYSGIRYFLNSIIIINEWHYYMNKSSVPLYNNSTNNNICTCFTNRLRQIQNLNKIL